MRVLLVSLDARYIHTPLAALKLHAALARKGIDAELYQGDVNKGFDVSLRDIARLQPDVIGFSCYIWNIALVRALTCALRKILPQAVLIWGGPEVSYNAQEHLEGTPALDVVICGEGEMALPAALDALARKEAPQGNGICTRASHGGVAQILPVEDWVDEYADFTALDPNRLWYIETVRGCPYACRYCLSSATGPVRALSAQESVRRILHLRDAGAVKIKLVDRTFNFDKVRARSIWRTLIAHGQGATYHFEIAANLLDEEDLALLAKAPVSLFQLEVGVQSTTPDCLERVGRTLDIGQIRRAVSRVLEGRNIQVHMDLIAGLPGENLAQFAHSFDQVHALHPDRLQLGFLKVLPGTPMREDFARGAGRFHADPPYEVLCTREMAFSELSLIKDVEELVEVFYNTHQMDVTCERYLTGFTRYVQYARALRDAGFFDRGQGEMDRFAALYGALRACGHDAELLECSLRYDWLRARKRPARPGFMVWDQEDCKACLDAVTDNAQQRRSRHAERFAIHPLTGERLCVIAHFDYSADSVEFG